MKKLAIILVGLTTACSGLTLMQGKEEQPLITIDGEQITADEFNYAFAKNRPADSAVTRKDIDDYLELYVNFKLKVIEAKKRGYDTTAAFKKEYRSYINQLDNSYLKSSNDTDSLVKQAFNRLQFEIRASHILIAVDENALPEDTLKAYNKAMALRDSIIYGASFEELAIANSDDPSAKQNKGDLGYFTVLQMVYPFETAAYNTAVGEVSMPVRTRFGYHIIKVTDQRLNEGKVRVAHIMIRTSKDAHDRIIDVYDQLMAGADWNEVCQKYSEDAQTAARGGVLTPFGRNQIVKEFAEAAFSLNSPGEISEPIQTMYGWHIIKLLERLPADDFAANERQLRAQVRRDARSQISRKKMLDRLAKENDLQENLANIQQVAKPENHEFVKGKWVFTNDSLANLVLFTIADTSFTASEFYNYIEKTTQHQQTKAFLMNMYKKFKEDNLIKYEKAHLAEKYDDYKYLQQEYYDGILLFSIMEKEVWAKAGEDSLGLAGYYEEHKQEYIDSTTVGVLMFSSPVRTVIDSVTRVFPDAESYQKLSYPEKQAVLSTNNSESKLSLQIESGDFKPAEDAVLAKLTLPYTDSLLQVDDRWYYVLVLRRPDEPRSLSDVKGNLIAGYQEVLEESWLKELKEKYVVEINESTLKKVYKDFEVQ